MFARKGLVKLLKSTHRVDSNMALDNVIHPGEIKGAEDKKEDDENETSFNVVKERKSISKVMFTKIKSNYHDLNNSEDGAYIFLDENGIPEFDHEKFVGNESTQQGIETRV